MKKLILCVFALSILGAGFGALPLKAHAPSGAIFTTLSDGSEVNTNQFSSKEEVYLDGGPGPGAPQTAAGLDDGFYYFQVTDPSGKTLLSEDPVECREFQVSGGIIVAYTGGCAHATGVDQDHGGVTVGLAPFADTPNHGGVYKVWVTFVEDYSPGSGKHGFVPAHSKTDNFKVRQVPIREIDTIFFDRNTGEQLSGLGVTWIDTHGATNKKWSYLVMPWAVIEAHVEAVEDGEHYIVIENQPGCTVREVYRRYEEQNYTRVTETFIGEGPRTVSATISKPQFAMNVFMLVYCDR